MKVHIDGVGIKIRDRHFKVGDFFGKVPLGQTCVIRDFVFENGQMVKRGEIFFVPQGINKGLYDIRNNQF